MARRKLRISVLAIAVTFVVTAGIASVAAGAYTPEHGDKYFNSRVLYDADSGSVTIHSRHFQGARNGGSLFWRQLSIRDVVSGEIQESYGPGEWVDNEYLSPWYVYRSERPRTYFAEATVFYSFQYYRCIDQFDKTFTQVPRGTICKCWAIGTPKQPVAHTVAPSGG